MKAIVTESPARPAPTGPRLMRDKRYGSVILVTDDNKYIKLSMGSSAPLKFGGSDIGHRYPDWTGREGHLEPFNGSITLSNE